MWTVFHIKTLTWFFLQPFFYNPNLMSSWLMTDGGHEKKKFF